jgi:Ser/Thr protein kinase RdoA (MazF antagonist)
VVITRNGKAGMMRHRRLWPALPPPLVAKILSAFGQENPASYEIVPMAQGFGPPVTHVRKGDRDFVIKMLRPGRPAARLRFALQFQDELQGAGVPCPGLLRTPDGDLGAMVRGNTYFVQRWCTGHRFTVDSATSAERTERRRQVGQLIGAMHAAASTTFAAASPMGNIRTPRDDILGFARIDGGLPWPRLGALGRAVWFRLKENGDFGREVQEVIPRLIAARERLQACGMASDPRTQELIPVHGDIHFENILFDGHRLSAIVDFDSAMVASRALDVGIAMAVICEQREDEAAFLAGYEAGYGRARPDADVLRAGVQLRLVRSLSYQIIEYTHRRATSPEQARWWMRRLMKSLEHERREG